MKPLYKARPANLVSGVLRQCDSLRRFEEILPFESVLPSDGEEEEEAPTEFDSSALPGICADLSVACERADEDQTRISLRKIRAVVRLHCDAIAALLLDSNAISLISGLIHDCDSPVVLRSALRALYSIQFYVPALQVVISQVTIIDRLLAIISDRLSPGILSAALLVLHYISVSLGNEDAAELRRLLPIEEIYQIHLFTWNPPVDSSAGPFDRLFDQTTHLNRRFRLSLGYWSLLPSYCVDPLTSVPSDFVLNLILALFHSAPQDTGGARRVQGHEGDSSANYYDRLVFRAFTCLLNLLRNGSLSPDDFAEPFGWFVNGEIQNGHFQLRALGCQLWAVAIERGNRGEGVNLNEVLDVVESTSVDACSAALTLIGTMLEMSPMADELVAELVSAHETSQGFRSMLKARGNSFHCMAECARCMALIFAGSREPEMEVLVCPQVITALVDFVSLDEESLVLFALRAMAEMFEFATAYNDERRFNEVLAQFLEVDGPEVLVELKMGGANPQIGAAADAVLAIVDAD
jgi:hypothetical protein